MKRTALAIEDEALIVRAYERGLRAWGWQVQQADSIADARRKFEDWATQSYAAVIIDVGLPDGDGTVLLREIDRLDPRPIVVVVSGTLHAPDEIELQRRSIKVLQQAGGDEGARRAHRLGRASATPCQL